MNAMELRLDPAGLDDGDALLAWRNDPLTRAQSRHGDPVVPAAHWAWLSARLASVDCLMLIGRAAGERCGVVRFDRRDGRVWEVSITIAPWARGRGLARLLLAAGIARLRRAHAGAVVLAAVRPGNRASESLFLGAGFTPQPSDEEFAHYLLDA